MGLNYSYVLLVAKAEEPTLRAQLAAAGSVTELAAPFGTCLWLDFPLDETLLTYLLDTLREQETRRGNQPGAGNWWEYPASFPSATLGRVGCIYFELLPVPTRAYVYARFTAATTRMSQLFQHAASLKNWFLQLSTTLNAQAAFLDLEAEGYHFFALQGRALRTTLP